MMTVMKYHRKHTNIFLKEQNDKNILDPKNNHLFERLSLREELIKIVHLYQINDNVISQNPFLPLIQEHFANYIKLLSETMTF